MGFQSERGAKEYLVARIVSEAQREGAELSDLETKMLYFSETGWTLSNMLEVNAEFERTYDNDDYERKIAGLIREIETRNHRIDGKRQSEWDEAIFKLGQGDHYLLVLIGRGRSSPAGQFSKWLPVSNFYGTEK